MLIQKHKSARDLVRSICSIPAWRWTAVLPADVLQTLLTPVAMVAEWIAQHRSDLLTRDELVIVVVGSAQDTFEEGALWSALAVMLGKQPGWVTGQIQVNGGGRLGPRGQGRLAPRFATERISLAKVKENIAGVEQMVGEGTDLIISTVGSQTAPAGILSGNDARVEAFVKRGGGIVSLALGQRDALVMGGIAVARGMTVGSQESKLVRDAGNALFRWISWQCGPANAVVTGQRLQGLADFTVEVVDALESMDGPFADLMDPMQIDPTVWGVEGLLKSSVDANDTYISLPRSLALRRSTSEVVTIERELVSGGMTMRVDGRAIEAYDELGESWIERAGWVASLWNNGMGKAIDNTLMGRMDSLGVGTGRSDLEDGFKKLIAEAGMSPEHAQLMADALTGGQMYAPTKEERQVFEMLRRGDLAGMLRMVEVSPSLARAMNEQRELLLHHVALRAGKREVASLIVLGGDPNQVDGGGRTVLTSAAAEASADSIGALVDGGGYVNAYDPLRWTPLLMAMKRGRWDVAGLLIERGADVHWEGFDGLSACSFARGKESLLKGLDDISSSLNDLPEPYRLPNLPDALKRSGLLASASDVPSWLRAKLEAAA